MSSSKVIIVTGASRGIGLAVCRYLLQPPHSSRLVILARSRSALETLQTEAPDRIAILAGDAADLSLGQQAVDLALSKWGRLDGVVVNHGRVEPVERVADADIDAWRASFDVNVLAGVALIKAALPALRDAKGRIVLTSSGAAVTAYTAWGSYGAGKAALNHLALTLGKEEPEVTTVAVRPGVVATEMQASLEANHWSKMAEVDVQKFRTEKAEGKMLRPEQPGNVIAQLVLDAPKELSGLFLSWSDERLSKYQES